MVRVQETMIEAPSKKSHGVSETSNIVEGFAARSMDGVGIVLGVTWGQIDSMYRTERVEESQKATRGGHGWDSIKQRLRFVVFHLTKSGHLLVDHLTRMRHHALVVLCTISSGVVQLNALSQYPFRDKELLPGSRL